ncbi:MAG: oligogalacturonate lyase family protein [Bullifex sp.]
MKGTYYNLERKEYKDPLTGVRVIRMTDNRAFYDRPYFTTRQFSSDGRYTLFVSDFTGTSKVKNPDAPAIGKVGFGELFLLDMVTGSVLQVTQGEAIKMGHGAHCMISPSGDKAYCYSNEYVKEVDLKTLESRELIYVPYSYNFHSLSITDDGRYIAFSVVEEIPLLTAGFADPLSEAAPGARERYFNEPRSLIIRYDLKKGTAECVFGGHHRITHASLKPDDGNCLLFCHDGPWHLVQRMWTMRISSDDVKPLFVQQHNLEGVVHEFFTPSGRVGAQYSFRYKSDMAFFMFADVFMDFDGSNQERYYYPYSRPGHVSVNVSGTLGCGDAGCIRKDTPHPERYLSLIRYDKENHTANPEILCEHNTSGKKSAHVHPVFTPDGKNIVFSSDCEGKLNIYMAEVDEERTIKG